MVGLYIPDGEKKTLRMCNRLDTIPACDGRTDILPQHSPRYAYASRGKNDILQDGNFKHDYRGLIRVVIL